jgi:tripartite-type tricarboxylate transporter receptor subunit TctC
MIRTEGLQPLGPKLARWPSLTDVPTFKELGYPDISLNTEHFLAPAGTPNGVVDRMSKAAQAVLAQDDVKRRLVELGYLNVVSAPWEAKARIAKDVSTYKRPDHASKDSPIQ